MAALIVDEGLERMLKMAVNLEDSEDLYLHLFVAAHTPAQTDTVDDYLAIEADVMTGYAPVLLLPAGWFLNVTSGVVSMLYTPVDFDFTSGPFTVHGSFLTFGPTGPLFTADELAAPVAVDMAGDPTVTISMQLQSKNCP